MDPNFNGQQWQQQYFTLNEQYAQPLQQQSTGVPQYGYVSTAQQTPNSDSFAQQGVSQPSYQGLMQQIPTHRISPNPQLEQRPSHQHFGQGVSSGIPALSAPAGPWTQTRPNAQ